MIVWMIGSIFTMGLLTALEHPDYKATWRDSLIFAFATLVIWPFTLGAMLGDFLKAEEE